MQPHFKGHYLTSLSPPHLPPPPVTQVDHRWRLEGSEARAAKVLRQQLSGSS